MESAFATYEDFEQYWEDPTRESILNAPGNCFKTREIGAPLYHFYKLFSTKKDFFNLEKFKKAMLSFVRDDGSPLKSDLNLNYQKILNVQYDFQENSVLTNKRLNALNLKWSVRHVVGDKFMDIEFCTNVNTVFLKLVSELDFKTLGLDAMQRISVTIPNSTNYNALTQSATDCTDEYGTALFVDQLGEIHVVPVKFSMNKTEIKLVFHMANTKYTEATTFKVLNFKLNYFIEKPL
ncbi:hypothetical protein [Carp edema virus]|nr:hypothetical protein [Carp edema virus]